MEDKKRRRKTGCLTCRMRRVKCDEGRPTCQRCAAANIECAGYEGKRRLDFGKLSRGAYNRQQCSSHTATVEGQHSHPGGNPLDGSLVHQREDGLPLVGLPVNPTPFQRPHARARDILAYHQFLFRTVPVLFSSHHMFFWRDYMCEQCWDTEYVYDAITALGSMHRATLLLSQGSEDDGNRGLDTKVIACQAYSRALQGFSNADKTTICFVGVIILCAYFECFAGNIPATTRHFRTANYYARRMISSNIQYKESQMAPIQYALQDLALTCHIILPLPNSIKPTQAAEPASIQHTVPDFDRILPPRLSCWTDMLQALLHLSSTDDEIQELIWNSVTISPGSLSMEKVRGFNAQLNKWKGFLGTMLLKYNLDFPLSRPQHLTWQVLHQLPIPPLPYSGIPMQFRLILSLYIFYVARIKWAIGVSSDDGDDNEIEAYFYFYQQLRLASTDLNFTPDNDINNSSVASEPYYACESVKIGFSPLLYLAGHCCYRMSGWMQWIAQKLSQMGQEGLFNSQLYAMTLETLIQFENLPSVDGSNRIHFSTDRSNRRVSSILIPCCYRRAYVAYYLYWYSRHDDNQNNSKKKDGNDYDTRLEPGCYYLSGKSRWGDSTGSPSNSQMAIYDANAMLNGPVTTEWLLNQPMTIHWAEWALNQEFQVDCVLTDHIVGGSLDRLSVYRYEMCTVF